MAKKKKYQKVKEDKSYNYPKTEVNNETAKKTKYKKRNWNDYLKEEKIQVEYQIKIKNKLDLKEMNKDEPKITIKNYNNSEEEKINIENDKELNTNLNDNYMKNTNNNEFNSIMDNKKNNSEWDNILLDNMEKNLNDLSNSSKSSKNTNSDESESNQKEENIKNGELKEIPIKLSSKIELNKKAENLDSKAKTDDDEVKDNKEINIIHGTNESIIFDNKEFKIYNRANKYQKKDEIKRIIYKCKNHRKDEKIRSEMGLKSFCNATIEYIIPNQKIKSSYILTKDHSLECNNLKLIDIIMILKY